MTGRKGLFDIIKWKLVGSALIGMSLWLISGALEFPLVFRIMFVLYAVLGFCMFVLLDLPPMPELSGGKVIAAVTVFYLICSAVYTAAGSFLPQFDPEWEKGKIQKILEAKKRDHPMMTPQELSKKADEVGARTDELMARLARLEESMARRSPATETPSVETPAGKEAATTVSGGTPADPAAYGKEVYNLYECYNCHKLGGKGGTKRRGPALDNIGNLVSAEMLKKKLLDPMAFSSEGFEKEYKKGVMPDNFPELMTDQEMDALVAYLLTLKNPAAKTPKPIMIETGE